MKDSNEETAVTPGKTKPYCDEPMAGGSPEQNHEEQTCQQDKREHPSRNMFSVVSAENVMNESGEYQLKVYKTQLLSMDNMSLTELFSGFDMLHAITFSYDIGFLNEILGFVSGAEVVLGADFLTEKDQNLQYYLAEVLANSLEAAQSVARYQTMTDMIRNGDLTIKTPNEILDHRKLYILSTDDGRRTRVIRSSANMTRSAWNGGHLEHYEMDETLICYEELMSDFETIWSISSELPHDAVAGKKTKDPIEGNPIVRKSKEKNEIITIRVPEEIVHISQNKFFIEHTADVNIYATVVEGSGVRKPKDGLIELKSSNITKMVDRYAKTYRRKVELSVNDRPYPSLTFDFDEGTAYLDGKRRDLCPPESAVCNDIDVLLHVFSNFDRFVDERGDLKESHFKLLNLLLCSPYFSRLRFEFFCNEVTTTTLPMFALVSSETANSGKSFMITLALKMMTGLVLPAANRSEVKKENVSSLMENVKGCPYFIDEIDGRFFSSIKPLIKQDQLCSNRNMNEMPLIVMASNDVLDPDDSIRKRIAYFKMHGALPSSEDSNRIKGQGMACIRDMGDALYREYTRHMLEEVTELLRCIIEDRPQFKDPAWYPDIINISSMVLMRIMKKYGYDIPPYMFEVEWERDYNGAKYIARDAFREILDLYHENWKAFKITDKLVIITLGNDTDTKKRLQNWKNTLPAEMKAQYSSTRDNCSITINRQELEKQLNQRFSKFRLW